MGGFYTTLTLIKNPFQTQIFDGTIDMKFPFHYYFFAPIYYLTKDPEYLRIFSCFFSFFCPLIFYFCLKEKYQDIDKDNLFYFSLVLFILPSFRSSAIWVNTLITAIFFSLIGLYFFLKWQNLKKNKVSKYLILSVIFLSIAVYTRQEYALVCLFIVTILFKKLELKQFIFILFFWFILSLPGISLAYHYPTLFPKYLSFNIYNSILVNLSIICFYLAPIMLLEKFYQDINQKVFYFIIITIPIILILSFNFDYNFRMGGGFFIKSSIIFFDNLIFFFLTSFIGLLFVGLICFENKINIFFFLILIFGFSSNVIFQKYYEPLFLILFFLLYQTNLTYKIIVNKTKIFLFHIYFLFYLIAAIFNNYFLVTKSI